MPSNRPAISIILPTYNESGNILTLTDTLLTNLSKLNPEIIIIDDNSPDHTGKLAEKRYTHNKQVRVTIRKERGLASAIYTGIKAATGNIITVMDTDFNHDPEVIKEMIKLLPKFDMVTGSRYIQGGGMENKLRNTLSMIYNRIIQKILRLDTRDNLSGFFSIKTEKLRLLPCDLIFYGYGDYFIRLLFYSDKYGLGIREIPVFYKNRTAGVSKSRLLTMLFDYSRTVFELLKSESKPNAR